MNALNAEWRSIAILGENPALLTEWYQPLDNRENYFINPVVSVSRQSFNLYAGNNVFSKHQIKQTLAELWVGRNFDHQSSRLRFGISRGKGRVDLLVGNPADERIQFDNIKLATFSAEFLYDSLDTVSFPFSGSAMEVIYNASRESIGSDDNSDQVSIQAVTAYSVGSGTLLFAGGYK